VAGHVDECEHANNKEFFAITNGWPSGVRLAIYFSEASKRRSRCGSVRGSPVLSSHFSPGLAPQVGQRTVRAGTGLVFIAT
jgi:hypothetical protein